MAAVPDPRGSTDAAEGVAARLPATALRSADPLADRNRRVAAPIRIHGRAARRPISSLEHTHRLRRVDGGTEIYDRVVYRLPYEPFAGLLAPVTVRPWLKAIFDYRARQTKARLGRDGRRPLHARPARARQPRALNGGARGRADRAAVRLRRRDPRKRTRTTEPRRLPARRAPRPGREPHVTRRPPCGAVGDVIAETLALARDVRAEAVFVAEDASGMRNGVSGASRTCVAVTASPSVPLPASRSHHCCRSRPAQASTTACSRRSTGLVERLAAAGRDCPAAAVDSDRRLAPPVAHPDPFVAGSPSPKLPPGGEPRAGASLPPG